jgi:hypothetical protein
MCQFGDITNRSNPLGSELDFLKYRIFSEEFWNRGWDIKFGQAEQEDCEWASLPSRHSLRRYCPLR